MQSFVMSEKDIQDYRLVEQCLAGSKAAWDEFFDRYLLLVRKVIHRHVRCNEHDMQDLVQNIFLAIFTALKNYDHQYPLSRFVWVVGERVCIDEFRRNTAAKRDGETVHVNHHDHADESATMVRSNVDMQDNQVERSELLQLLRLAFRQLSDRCRELLRLRYIEELSFKEIIPLLGGKEKTLAVQAGRCLEELKTVYDQGQLEGWRP
jgi:RNA polymerase sigma-70 factor, ECF subfamily